MITTISLSPHGVLRALADGAIWERRMPGRLRVADPLVFEWVQLPAAPGDPFIDFSVGSQDAIVALAADGQLYELGIVPDPTFPQHRVQQWVRIAPPPVPEPEAAPVIEPAAPVVEPAAAITELGLDHAAIVAAAKKERK